MATKTEWTCLEVIDRETGDVERIRLEDGNAAASVEHAADRLQMTSEAAWSLLRDGATLNTAGFSRRLATGR